MTYAQYLQASDSMRRFHERRASSHGMTVEQWFDHLQHEHAVNELIMDHALQVQVLARYAQDNGRRYEVLS